MLWPWSHRVGQRIGGGVDVNLFSGQDPHVPVIPVGNVTHFLDCTWRATSYAWSWGSLGRGNDRTSGSGPYVLQHELDTNLVSL